MPFTIKIIFPQVLEKLSPVEVADRSILCANEILAFLVKICLSILGGYFISKLLPQEDSMAPTANHPFHQLSHVVLWWVLFPLYKMCVEFEGAESQSAEGVAIVSLGKSLESATDNRAHDFLRWRVPFVIVFLILIDDSPILVFDLFHGARLVQGVVNVFANLSAARSTITVALRPWKDALTWDKVVDAIQFRHCQVSP